MKTSPLILLIVATLVPVVAQQQKRPLRHSDYDSWNAISGQTLTRDGKYLAYSLFPQEGDGVLVLRNLATGAEVRKPVGSVPPAPEAGADENPDAPAPVRGIRIQFTSDSRYLVANTFPSKKETDDAKKARKPADQMPKNGLIILELANGKETRAADVATLQVPENGGPWLAYRKGPKPAPPAAADAKPTAPGDDDEDQGRRGAAAGGARGPAASRDEYGSDLVLRNLSTGSERTFEDALDFSIAKDGKTLVWNASSRKDDANGIYVYTPGTDGAPTALMAGKGKYTRPSWDRPETQLVFLANKPDALKFRAFLWKRSGGGAPVEIDASSGLQPGYEFADKGQISFSWDTSRVYIPVMTAAALARANRKAPATPAGEEQVLADLWHYKDDYVQPMQKIRAAQDRSRSFRAVYDIGQKKLLQVTSPELPLVATSDDGRYGIGSDDRKYRSMIDYDGTYADLYLVDTASGDRKPLIEKFRGGATWSPKGDYTYAFKGRDWWSIRVPDGAMTNLTTGLGVKFFNERHDSPSEPSTYGSAGWLKDGSAVLLYDAFDIWLVSVDGKVHRRLTQGREEKIQYRINRLEPEGEDERGFDPAKPVYLRGEHDETHETGMFRLPNLAGTTAPRKLIWGPKNYRVAGKAKDADVVLLTGTTFSEDADLHVTDSSFKSPKKVTTANPQRAGLLWGTSEMVQFHNADGVPLQAALYKPENFDPKKKYPVIVYIYERLSQTIHTFNVPRPGHSVNPSFYVSNGYLIYMPDIVYTTGSPGQSALKAVLPAIEELVKKGYVDERRIGIQGHSWGGYQIAYMVTHTNRFRAAEAGAPVGNMTSAYNGIRWGTGMPRQFQYEKTQSRIGGTLWENPLDFIENSPVFRANKINTPLLILHDDEDDAVPWYQGIELFLSLRRNGKEAYLFNYNGEKHGLRKRHNQKDFVVRMQQYFDYFLKDAPKPDWMEKGIPYNDREDEKKSLNQSAYPNSAAATAPVTSSGSVNP